MTATTFSPINELVGVNTGSEDRNRTHGPEKIKPVVPVTRTGGNILGYEQNCRGPHSLRTNPNLILIGSLVKQHAERRTLWAGSAFCMYANMQNRIIIMSVHPSSCPMVVFFSQQKRYEPNLESNT